MGNRASAGMALRTSVRSRASSPVTEEEDEEAMLSEERLRGTQGWRCLDGKMERGKIKNLLLAAIRVAED